MGIARVAVKHSFLNAMLAPVGFATLIASTHILGTDGRGLFAAVYIIPNIIALFGGLGLVNAAFYFRGRGGVAEERALATTYWSQLALGSLWAVLFVLTLQQWPEILVPEVTRTMILLVAAHLPLVITSQTLSSYLVHLHRVTSAFAISGVTKVSKLVALVLFGLLLFPSAPYGELVLYVLWFNLGLGVSQNLMLIRLVGFRKLAFPAFGLLRKLLSVGFPTVLVSSAMYLLRFGDQFYLQALGSDPLHMLGVYTVAYGMYEMVTSVSRSVSVVALRINLESKSDRESDRLALMIARRMVVLSIVLGLGLYVGVHWVIGILMPPEFSDVTQVLYILILGAPCYAISSNLDRLLFARRKMLLIAIGAILALVTNVGLNILWIPESGMYGAAWATVISFVVLALSHFMSSWWSTSTRTMSELFALELEDFAFFLRKALVPLREVRKRLRSGSE